MEKRDDPVIVEPTDAVIRLSAACVCGSDLWPYRGSRRSTARLRWGTSTFSHVHLHGGPAPVRRFLPELVELICDGRIDPGRVFDLTLPLDQAAEGYRAMDERRAIKTLLTP
ncbi:hypothetical protein [Saccharothrix luteola]|uniref:hypothetical protein n=1 Tax=Saccharothrix luteola TaxID=2893018 RepID=UPI001E4AEDE5|nr:hypothetical protein [Saccharothrix luteola]MCC8247792.1 hypothetical protein [Saccharothrix luteola]